jgi:hypothetical protein
MFAFHAKVPEIGFTETRSATILPGNSVPAGEYGFIEFYCDDPQCDCRRVMVKVVGRDNDTIWATISYGWETAKFYKKWMYGAATANDLCGASLDPLNPQSAHAEGFLALFNHLLRDKDYVARLKRHYTLFRKAPRLR